MHSAFIVTTARPENFESINIKLEALSVKLILLFIIGLSLVMPAFAGQLEDGLKAV
jgi:hypothetical protein